MLLTAFVVVGSVLAAGPAATSAWALSDSPDPAKLQVLRAGVKDGRLDVLAAITKRADGTRVNVAFVANGTRWKFAARVRRGQVRFKRRLPPRQRRASTGIIEIRYAGNDRVRPAEVRLRAATGKAGLKRDLLSLHRGVLTARGSLSGRARGVVRLILSFVRASGGVGEWHGRARIRQDGRWSMRETLPSAANAGGYMSIQFTGEHPRVRGEQIAKQLLDGQSFGESPPRAQAEPAAQPAGDGELSVPITAWRAPGSAPLSDAQAAGRVQRTGEIVPENAAANAYRPSAGEIRTFLEGQRDTYRRLPADYNPALAKVTGNFAGTTDEILQWAAHKWGIPEDLARAVAVTESYWRQQGVGDRRTVLDVTLYPLLSRILGTAEVYESLGIMQIKWRPDGSMGTGTEPLRWKSTAFNADYWGATVRYYYDGNCSWCGAGYSAAQEKLSIGAWYSPSSWGNPGQQEYVTKVWNHVASRTWTRPGF